MKPRVLIAGIGNDLCRDDGFGIVALRRLAEAGVPDGVKLYESGIAGIGLVQELMDGYEAVVFVDAVDRGGEPGTVYLLETEVPEISDENRDQFLADMHFVVPSTALLLGKALNVLPPRIFILGCQPAEYGLGLGLSAPVEAAVAEAIRQLRELTATLLKEESHVPSHTA
ncbi:MAG: hydrogenase maturation protease [Chloroflexia bacterium]|nr:hydrogenase maturation protease [Chloroflexia bacterium]